MDPPVRDHLRYPPGAPQSAARRRLASRRPVEFRYAARGQGVRHAWRRNRESGGDAVDVPATAAAAVFLESVSVLPQCDGRKYGVLHLGRPYAESHLRISSGAIQFRPGQHEPGVDAHRLKSVPPAVSSFDQRGDTGLSQWRPFQVKPGTGATTRVRHTAGVVLFSSEKALIHEVSQGPAEEIFQLPTGEVSQRPA